MFRNRPSPRRAREHLDSALPSLRRSVAAKEGCVIATTALEHGSRFGDLTVLRPCHTKNGLKYRVGCACGLQMLLRPGQLTGGRYTACGRCKKS